MSNPSGVLHQQRSISIPRSREDMEEYEQQFLAPWAQHSADSMGRQYPERPHPFRTTFQRDRARIVHSISFRRLEGKTQVFLSPTAEHLRTRLTHTIEVVSIARALARALCLNEDLAESIALAHDLGHSPFGHCGEEVLEELMAAHGGFEHNLQSLRIVEKLEKKYPGFPGLNLSYEMIEGLQKHNVEYRLPNISNSPYSQPSLEAQLAHLADEIAYYSHDLDDGINLNLLDPDQLDDLEIWDRVKSTVLQDNRGMSDAELQPYIIRCIIDLEVEDVIRTSTDAMAEAGIRNVMDVRLHPDRLIRYSEDMTRMNAQLRAYLFDNMYHHPRVQAINDEGCRYLREVFNAIVEDPDRYAGVMPVQPPDEPPNVQRRVCDYISGMTDRFLIAEHRRLFPRKR
jgi:dGTPase